MKPLSCSSFSRVVPPCLTITLVLLAAGIAHAGSLYTVTLAPVGPDVVATGSGTIDLTGLTFELSTSRGPELYPAHGILGVGPFANIDEYFGQTGPASFGPGFGGFPISASGDSVFLEDFAISIDVPQGYISGSSLFGTATYVGTITSLGLTPGTYTWTWNSGANSFVLQVPMQPIPEPSSLLLLGIGLLGGLWLARKQVFGQALRRQSK